MMNLGTRLAAGMAVAACLAGSGCADSAAVSDGRHGTAWQWLLEATAPSALAQGDAASKPKKGFVDNITRLTVANDDYRRVLYTGQHLQLVLMALKPGEEIGEEMHATVDQFFRVETGDGEIIINGAKHPVSAGYAMVVPAGARHTVRNTGKAPLKLYTLYAPPQHRRDVVQRTKADAKRQQEHFDGKTSE